MWAWIALVFAMISIVAASVSLYYSNQAIRLAAKARLHVSAGVNRVFANDL